MIRDHPRDKLSEVPEKNSDRMNRIGKTGPPN